MSVCMGSDRPRGRGQPGGQGDADGRPVSRRQVSWEGSTGRGSRVSRGGGGALGFEWILTAKRPSIPNFRGGQLLWSREMGLGQLQPNRGSSVLSHTQ